MRDSGLCAKAIREAWEREADLITQGYGSRDWTPEQQADILAGITPVDENGKAIEGHHAWNVEDYPDRQGDPENIQFLTREEHFQAHDNNFQNETHGFFHPETGETNEDAPLMQLSNPIEIDEEDAEETANHSDTGVDVSEAEDNSENEDLDDGLDDGIDEEL